MKVLDLLLHHLKADRPWNKPEESPIPPPQERVSITSTLWIGPVSDVIAQTIFQTCRPGAFGFERRQLRCRPLYVYGKEVPSAFAANKEGWDDDGKLQALVAISRLVYPTSASLRMAVRIELDETDTVAWISQARLEGLHADAFASPENRRDWLSWSELNQLKEITWPLDRGLTSADRVWRALWYHEYMSRSYEMDIRWPLATSALESLLKTERRFTGDQFRKRSVQLAAEIGIIDYGEAEADRAWDRRSGLAHGQILGTLSADDLKLYDLIESLLRTALLRALRDEEFRKVLNDDALIRKRWPV